MSTLDKLKIHVEEIINRGAPFSKEDLNVLKIYNQLVGGKAFNAGKRNKSAENDRLIKGK